ncbi:protein translocase subunit SecF [Gloeocapsa sp. PCC 73106]|uniref:protein translocase subunit SecF n=1 Tax=Gloeocapsa sp. PCC 73106 TaxID=102232 RepID=UPI0002AC2A45|nr:protein translocase subunit SecF [Gloeocapsa sp. PCC 73106]ELR98059.1 protein-export membrane protein, SecD/SecF family [Gloeocapsa sp. PCC 73106]
MKLNVIKYQKLWWSISALAIALSIIAMIISWSKFNAPLRPGLDFVGGTRLQIELDCTITDNCSQPIDSGKVREVLASQQLADSSIQVIEDHGLSIRSQDLNVDQRTQLIASLSEKIGTFDSAKTQIDTVGPTIGKELFRSGILALIVSFLGIIAYLTVRFKFDYAFFAIIALAHDVLIATGVFAFLGIVLGVEVDSLFLVSLLTISGFSVNDTVVIYDRIREIQAEDPELDINEVVDQAVNQTLGRSINTTLTTLLPLVTIFIFGGETLKYFALALIVGFIAGAYSSIFIASTLLAWWRRNNRSSKLAVQ